MKYLLFSGAQNTGKNALIHLTYKHLRSIGYTDVETPRPQFMEPLWYYHLVSIDFYALLEQGGKIVLFYTWSDTPGLVKQLAKLLSFYKKNGVEIDYLITGIRDLLDTTRDYSKKTLNLDMSSPNIVEFPLGKITRRGDGIRDEVINNWYHSKAFKIVKNHLIPYLDL